jgi:hypothetical protein
MSIRSLVAVLALVMIGQFAAPSARAQAAKKTQKTKTAQKKDTLTQVKSEGAVATPAPAAAAPVVTPPAMATVAAAPPADSAPAKKSGGMFGKLKGVAQNKKLQSVTKAALCTAVPGGQYMVAAADAAKNKQSVASSVANAQSCIPGMPGGMGGLPGVGGKGMGAAQIAAMAGGKGAPNAAQIAAMAGGKGMTGATGAALTAVTIQSLTTSIQSRPAPGGAGAEMTTEAPGQQLKLSGAVDDEIKKGKLTIKKIDWVHGSQNPSPSSTQGFMDLMTTAGQAIKATGATYRVDIWMDKKYSDAEIASLGQQRTMLIVQALQAGGQLGDVITGGKVGKDKEPRVEIVKTK